MVDGTYDLIVGMPAGEKRGTAVLTTDGDVLIVEVKVPGFSRQKGMGVCHGDAFNASGSIKVPIVGTFAYEIEGTVQDALLEATCKTDRGSLKIVGIRR